MAPLRVTEHHHGSHRKLLKHPVGFPMDVDAIIVPTMRNAATLKAAVRLANKQNATLVTLSSKWSTAREVAAAATGVKLIAIDVGGIPRGLMPSFETCQVLAGTKFERRTDTSLKRNLGLLLARLIGWERIVFLDDDIDVPEPTDLRDAAGLTDHFGVVGLAIDGMPDNSVVCHAFRDAGGAQDTFIGGGALAVGRKAMTSFFPNIYNEDWFFLLDDKGLRPTATTGRAVQKDFDPYREQRARMEELGDCLAEGLFWLLDSGLSLRDATTAHWKNFLGNRAEFITDVIEMVKRMEGDADKRNRMLLALKAARGRCQYIEPALCERYVDAWHADRVTWRRHVESLQDTHMRGRLRSVSEVRGLFRALNLPDRIAQLRLPH
jgi:glycosyltransferase involved in cell wall biosynthesis